MKPKLPARWQIQVRFGNWCVVCDCIDLNPIRPMSKRRSKELLKHHQARSDWKHRLVWVEADK